jgi:hypothetical protein
MPNNDPGSIIIRNATANPYTVEELGGVVLAPGATVDLIGENTETVHRYGDYLTANRLVTSLASAKLRRDIVAGSIVVDVNEPPERFPRR